MKFEELHISGSAAMFSEVPGPKSRELLRRQRELEGNIVYYPTVMPFGIKRAKGAIIEDVDGNQFIDFFAGCGVLNVGHSNEVVLQKVREQQDQIIHCLDFPTENKMDLLEKLLDEVHKAVPGRFRVNFCASTGSDAVEAAIKLAKFNVDRDGIFAYQGSYHGMTAGALNVTSDSTYREKIRYQSVGAHFLPACYCYRCPVKRKPEECDIDCLNYLENLLTNPLSGVSKPAAIIVEPVMGEGGIIQPRRVYFERLTELCHEHGILIIADEIQCGFFRTGNFFGFQDSGLVPDIITISKGLGGIGLPVSAIIYREELNTWPKGFHIGTFRGNQLSIAAGNAAMDFCRDNDIISHVNFISKMLMNRLYALAAETDIIGEVRGKGLYIGIEIVTDKQSKKPFADGVTEIRNICLRQGLLFDVGGFFSNVIRFVPPLVITTELVESAMAIFSEAVLAVNHQSKQKSELCQSSI